MKILITGGAGYIGYSVVKQLLEDVGNVHSIAIYDNLSRRNFSFFTEAKFDHKPVKLIQGDILDGRSLQKALEGIDCVVHLAARVTTPFADADAHSFDQVNHWGTAQLAYAIEKSSVSKVIYMSSQTIGASSPFDPWMVSSRTAFSPSAARPSPGAASVSSVSEASSRMKPASVG